MARRTLSLAPMAPAIAIIAFATAQAAADGAPPVENRLEDVQVGEAGNLLRVALICRTNCNVVGRAGGLFHLEGVASTLNIDLTGRSKLAKALDFKPEAGGAALRIEADNVPQMASIKPCRIDGAHAVCIDLEFERAAAPGQAVAAATSPPAAAIRPKPLVAEAETPVAAAEPKSEAVPPPALREAPEASLLTFTKLAEPERFAPPTAVSLPVRAGKAASPSIDGAAHPPIIDKARAEQLLSAKADFAARAADILGRTFSTPECTVAEGELKTDAWNLEAMVDVGFCMGVAGDLEKADDLFSRLLAYTPDNYEALVGRALIADEANEKSVARKYFQDALNASPPIAASGRIVEAMTKLSS